jgi:UMF1 family MFS transporter
MMSSPSIPRKEILAWCSYDFANSSFTTVIITAFYVLYFKNVVFGEASGLGDLWWGISISLSMIVVALSSPVLGAIADFSGAKKRFLMAYSALCIVFTGLLYFVGRGDLIPGVLFFVLANIGFEGALVFYNAFLPEIAGRHDMGKVSGWGWALGYLGGISCLLLVIPFAAQLKQGEAGLQMARLSFPIVALFFLLASLPTFLILRERAMPIPLSAGSSYLREGFRRLANTFRHIRQYRELLKFLLAFFVYEDAMITIIAFTASYADQTLHFTPAQNLMLILMVNPAAALGAFVFGYIFDRIGAKKTISWTLILWIIVVISAFFVQTKTQFLTVALIAGLVLGSTQSASRSLVGLFSPRRHNAEFFGFYAVSGKFSAIIGPLVFGTVSSVTQSQRLAVLSIGAFFLVGLILLQWVNEEKGIQAATRS